MDLKQAKELVPGDIIYHKALVNADNSPCRFRVNGAVKTLKRDDSYVRVPLKHGLYVYAYLVSGERACVNGKYNLPLEEFELTEEAAIEAGESQVVKDAKVRFKNAALTEKDLSILKIKEMNNWAYGYTSSLTDHKLITMEENDKLMDWINTDLRKMMIGQ